MEWKEAEGNGIKWKRMLHLERWDIERNRKNSSFVVVDIYQADRKP